MKIRTQGGGETDGAYPSPTDVLARSLCRGEARFVLQLPLDEVVVIARLIIADLERFMKTSPASPALNDNLEIFLRMKLLTRLFDGKTDLFRALVREDPSLAETLNSWLGTLQSVEERKSGYES